MKEMAVKKLDDELKSIKGNSHIAVMKKPVHDALVLFCQQDEEFAQAVMQGGSFSDCMKAVAKNCGTAISDLEAYRRAVQFYFPTADIRFQMEISLGGEDAPVHQQEKEAEKQSSPVILDLFDLL